ncbi:hypothetical protein ACFV2L_35770 [Streptomyces sp. NPDC059687]|uniref:hypothetical protein n=1 Tax=Streptomyces sp. NPDC059687 TaxID=3346905 RepID=UPI00369AF776
MSAATAGRVGRFYTAARRHPWVLGKVADWRIPLGPYTPAQLTVAVGGGFVLVKTIPWWSWMGPVPIAGWLLAIWMVRRPKVKGRAPLQAAWGWVLLVWQPAGGRIGGRAARDRACRALLGGFTLEDAPPSAVSASPRAAVPKAARPPRHHALAARVSVRRRPPVEDPLLVQPVSGVRQLLACAKPGGVR